MARRQGTGGVLLSFLSIMIVAGSVRGGGITLISPSGSGLIVHVGDTLDIQWKLDEDVNVPGLVIEVSGNSGLDFGQVTPLGMSTPAISPGTEAWQNEACRWIVEEQATNVFRSPPTTNSLLGDSSMLMIAGYMRYDVSAQFGPFSIRPKSASIRNTRHVLYLTPSTESGNVSGVVAYSVLGRAGKMVSTSPDAFMIRPPAGMYILRPENRPVAQIQMIK